MTRIELLNALIEHYGYKTYLEIGVNTPAQPGYSHEGIHVQTKHGVDPNVDTTFRMTSDDFFATHNTTYDIVFVDGLHTFEQAYRDIVNALNRLNGGGTIVVHDCNPTKEITQRPVRASSVWHGDVWKAILKLRMERADIEIYTVDTDEGCAIIRKGPQTLYAPSPNDKELYTYNYFNIHRKEILNLISVETFRVGLNLPTPSLISSLQLKLHRLLQRFIQALKKVQKLFG